MTAGRVLHHVTSRLLGVPVLVVLLQVVRDLVGHGVLVLVRGDGVVVRFGPETEARVVRDGVSGQVRVGVCGGELVSLQRREAGELAGGGRKLLVDGRIFDVTEGRSVARVLKVSLVV